MENYYIINKYVVGVISASSRTNSFEKIFEAINFYVS